MQTLDAFCREHHSSLVNHAVKLGETHGEAEDAVQDVWVKIITSGKIKSLVGEETPRAYLLTAVRRTIINRRKRWTRIKRGGAEPVSLDFKNLPESGHTLTPDRLLGIKEFTDAAEAIGVYEFEDKAGDKKEKDRRYRIRQTWRRQLAGLIP